MVVLLFFYKSDALVFTATILYWYYGFDIVTFTYNFNNAKSLKIYTMPLYGIGFVYV